MPTLKCGARRTLEDLLVASVDENQLNYFTFDGSTRVGCLEIIVVTKRDDYRDISPPGDCNTTYNPSSHFRPLVMRSRSWWVENIAAAAAAATWRIAVRLLHMALSQATVIILDNRCSALLDTQRIDRLEPVFDRI
jgi:hypothetical protein